MSRTRAAWSTPSTPSTRRIPTSGIALVIAVLALFLAFSETLGKSAQTEAISYNVEASNLWAFYQAKTIRQTSLRGRGRHACGRLSRPSPIQAVKDATTKQIEAWRKTAARYRRRSPKPTGGQGQPGAVARATRRRRSATSSSAKYHHYRDTPRRRFQIGIVLASATVITGIMALAFGSREPRRGRIDRHGHRPVRADT